MGTEQYHEPPAELSADIRTIARILTSLQEEAEAIGWYEQRMSVETDQEARAIMENAQHEEFKHFGMDLEFVLRRRPGYETSFRVPGYPVVPAIFLFVSGTLLVSTLLTTPRQSLTGLGVIALGLPVYWYWSRR